MGESRSRDELAGVLFELANPDRLTLLTQIGSKKQRMSTLSKALGASVPECSRHLSRLTDSGLVQKDSSGLYQATPVGRAMLGLLPGLGIIVRHREYFMTHDLTVLPEEFIQRIGALSEAVLLSHFSQVFDRIKATVSGAEEYSLLLVDKPILVGKEGGPNPNSSGQRAKFVFSEALDQKTLASVRAAFPQSEIAQAKEIKMALGVTEKAAGVILPSSNGKLDFGAGFFGESPTFRKWCSDLFEFHWGRSRRYHPPSPFSGPRPDEELSQQS